jgi:hypothetical protein
MARKALLVLVPAALTLIVAGGWNDIIRFLKIKQVGIRGGHPEIVPAEGRKAYPQRPGSGTPDGTGDFDSASRGGPASTR